MPNLLPFFRVLLIGMAVLAVADGGGLARAEGGDGGGAGTGSGSSGGGASAGHGEGGDGSTGTGPGVSAGSAASTGSAGAGASAGPTGAASSKGSATLAPSSGSAGMGSFLGGLGGFLTGGRNSGGRNPARHGAGNEGRSELRSEQGLARDAVSRGLVQPLDSILRNVDTAVPGSVLSARLKRDEGGVWLYRLVILSPEGRYRNVVVDASRNAILEVR